MFKIYEKCPTFKNILSAVLSLANEHFYKEFGVEWIVTKAIEAATLRREVFVKHGYIPMKDFALPDYYGRVEDEN